MIKTIMPLSYNDLKPGTLFIKDNNPYEVLEYSFVRMQQRKPVAQLKIKNLISGKVADFTAHQNDGFEQAEIEIVPVKFIYSHKNEFWFAPIEIPKQRFVLKQETLGEQTQFLKQDLELKAFKFQEKIINIELPIKIELLVTEAPPGLKGNTAQGGTKTVTVETGAKINTPLFINAGDLIKINTQTKEYVERAEKNR